MASVRVAIVNGVIHALYEGKMTMELVKEGEQKIEELIPSLPEPLVLYDCLAMNPPGMDLALEMKRFDSRIQPRIKRSATVVADAKTAFAARVAFALSRDHRVFYNDRGGAIAWLQSGVEVRRDNSHTLP